MKRGLFSILFFILLINFSYAELYADVVFHVDETGSVKITGNTNYENFKGSTNAMTSKSGDMWLLSISSPEFKEYLFKLNMPQNAIITKIESDGNYLIQENLRTMLITSSGENKSININVTYVMNQKQTNSSLFYIIGFIILLAVVGFYVFTRKKDNKQIQKHLYTEREFTILCYLKKHGPTSQIKLEKELKLPKASLFRNINSLVKKNATYKETKGMTNIIGLKNQ
jgi:uncharacterized membrane protein